MFDGIASTQKGVHLNVWHDAPLARTNAGKFDHNHHICASNDADRSIYLRWFEWAGPRSLCHRFSNLKRFSQKEKLNFLVEFWVWSFDSPALGPWVWPTKCDFKEFLNRNDFSQRGQAYGSSPVCIERCCLRLAFERKYRPQSLHLNEHSASCILLCCLSSCLLQNVSSHSMHL